MRQNALSYLQRWRVRAHASVLTVRIDEAELAAFRAGLRRRYTDDEILDELRAAAERLGRSPTMREFAQDPEARVHPQTVIEHFGTGTPPSARRASSRAGSSLARSCSSSFAGSARSSAGRRPRATSTSAGVAAVGVALRAHVRLAGERAPRGRVRGLQGEERLERAIEQGAALARALGRLPKMADWADARRADAALLSEWQVYRLLDVPRGAWTAFQYLVRERLREEGVDVVPDGTLVER